MPLTHPVPLVLLASVSDYERCLLQRMLEDADPLEFRSRMVGDAKEAEAWIESHPGPTVLVIDSGLLETQCDDQWRALRARRPALQLIVRMLEPERARAKSRFEGQQFVHPDDGPGLLALLRGSLSAPRVRPCSPSAKTARPRWMEATGPVEAPTGARKSPSRAAKMPPRSGGASQVPKAG